MIEIRVFDKEGFKVVNNKTYGEVTLYPRNEEQEKDLILSLIKEALKNEE